MNKWSAIYQPVPGGRVDGFDSHADAEEYILAHMCEHCLDERQRALAGDTDASEHPGCFVEWLILPTEKADSATNYQEILEAAGFEKVYPLEEDTPETPQPEATPRG